jgi:hypothetical protein
MMSARALLRMNRAVKVKGRKVIIRLPGAGVADGDGIVARFDTEEEAKNGARTILRSLRFAEDDDDYLARAMFWYEAIKVVEEAGF